MTNTGPKSPTKVKTVGRPKKKDKEAAADPTGDLAGDLAGDSAAE